MRYGLRSIFWIETVVASVTALLAVVTVLWPDWIERVLGIDPDRHSGSTEWELVVALLLGALLFAALARRDWQRISLATAAENGSAGT
jgi:hypothetical protein